MLSLSDQSNLPRSARPLRRFRGGFSLIEIVIALAVLGTMAAGVFVGFNGINTYAVSTRLHSEALMAAQYQIDLVLSKGPFDITAAYTSGSFDPSLNKIPAELMTATELNTLANTVPFPTDVPTATYPVTSPYYPYYPYYRTGPGQPLAKEAFIYQDPVTGEILVRGTLTTTITDASLFSNFINNNTSLNTRKAKVAVNYTFRGRNYTVEMDTLRTADQ